MGLFSFGGGSKSSSTSVTSEVGINTGDESLALNISGNGDTHISSDTPTTLRHLADVTNNIVNRQLDTSLEATRQQSQTASNLNLSLSEGLKELNLKSTEVKASNESFRYLIIGLLVLALGIILILGRKNGNKKFRT